MPTTKKTSKSSARSKSSPKPQNKFWSKLGNARTTHKVTFLLFVLIFAGVGSYFVFFGHALTYPYAVSSLATTDAGRINTYRTNRSWNPYTRRACLDTVAANWARSEAVNHRIADPSLSYMSSQVSKYCSSRWLGIGVNDGKGVHDTSLTYDGESQIWSALLNSCPHVRNIASAHAVKSTSGVSCSAVSTTFTYMGVSTYVGSDGYLYLSQWFARW